LKTLKLPKSVTDAGLEHLKNLTNLVTLELEGAAGVTDAGLAFVENLPNLKYLTTRGTGVTKAHVEQLKKKRKGLLIFD
jgi:hypothetical protein